MAMVQVDARICDPAGLAADVMPSQPQALRVHKPEEEIAMGEPAECFGPVNERFAAQLPALRTRRLEEEGACLLALRLPPSQLAAGCTLPLSSLSSGADPACWLLRGGFRPGP